MPNKYTRPHSHERVQAVERIRRAQQDEQKALTTVPFIWWTGCQLASGSLSQAPQPKA